MSGIIDDYKLALKFYLIAVAAIAAFFTGLITLTFWIFDLHPWSWFQGVVCK